MTTETLIYEIQAKNPKISKEDIMTRLEAERAKCGELLGDETLLRLIAAKLGIKLQQNTFVNCGSGSISSGRLFAGLYDVNVSGRLMAVFASKTFQGQEKSGKFATLMLGDSDGLLRVVLWNEKAELVERGELKAGQNVRFVHCYTRNDRYGKTELHLSDKSQVEMLPEEKSQSSPIEKFTQKIDSLNPNSGSVHLVGTVKAVLGKTGFTRGDSDGVVMRLAFRDDSGEAVVVVWNEKVDEAEKKLRDGSKLLLVNARVKEGRNGGLEVHVDSNTAIEVQK